MPNYQVNSGPVLKQLSCDVAFQNVSVEEELKDKPLGAIVLKLRDVMSIGEIMKKTGVNMG